MRTSIVSKFIARTSIALLTVAAFGAAASVKAQGTQLKVNVPFAFDSGAAHFAPGAYSIHLGVSGPIMRIQGDKSSAFQMTIPDISNSPSEHTKVVFARYGSRYVLKEVWVAGSTSHLHTPKSKLEKELELAQANEGKQNSLTVVASSR